MMKQGSLKPIPSFRSETEEREFWETHDTADYINWSRASAGVFPDLKPTSATVLLRLPASLLAEIKVLANRRDVPYQSLLKIFLAERIIRERAFESRHPPNTQIKRASRRSRPKMTLDHKRAM